MQRPGVTGSISSPPLPPPPPSLSRAQRPTRTRFWAENRDLRRAQLGEANPQRAQLGEANPQRAQLGEANPQRAQLGEAKPQSLGPGPKPEPAPQPKRGCDVLVCCWLFMIWGGGVVMQVCRVFNMSVHAKRCGHGRLPSHPFGCRLGLWLGFWVSARKQRRSQDTSSLQVSGGGPLQTERKRAGKP